MAGDGPYRRIGIIGTGRVASAMGLVLAPHSFEPLAIWGRNPTRCAAVATAIGRAIAVSDVTEIVAGCDLILLALSDDALPGAIRDLADAGGTLSPFVFHVSGRSGAALLAPLHAKGWPTAAIHPAMTFTGDPQAEARQMVGARFAVTGATEQAHIVAHGIVAWLGGIAVDIAEEHRPLYHAALCHGANHLVTLIAGACAALAASGVDDPSALLAPLVQAALENALEKGMAGLSGPLLRGDGQTIATHIASLEANCPSLLSPYRAMALATLDALERRSGVGPYSYCRPVLQRNP